ncbi:MAG: hypothetical protein PVG60_02360 [Desulfarculaceae bacterium]|jgi:hypothetical protein
MKWRGGGKYTMEALALISALVIVGIFVFSHYQRRLDTYDEEASRLARKIPSAVEVFFAGNPQARLTPEALKGSGLEASEQMHLEVPVDKDRPENWQVKLWHAQGVKLFTISAQGVEAKNR